MIKYLHKLSRRHFKILFFLTVVFVLYKALSPSSGSQFLPFEDADKFLHASAFFVLSFLLNRASSSIAKRFRNILSLLAFGILIEILQSFTGYRDVSVADVLADLVGILLFQLSYSFLKYTIELKRKRRD
jgi:VanZ family protein